MTAFIRPTRNSTSSASTKASAAGRGYWLRWLTRRVAFAWTLPCPILFRLGADQAWADKPLQPSGVRVQARPVIESKIDDDQPRCRQPLRDPLPRFHIS